MLIFAEAAAEIAEVSGREVRYVPVSLERPTEDRIGQVASAGG